MHVGVSMCIHVSCARVFISMHANMYRKLEQEYKESMTALRAELSREVELVQQQANQQREELEQEIGKMKDDEAFLREHLTLTIKVISILHCLFLFITLHHELPATCLHHIPFTLVRFVFCGWN